MVKVLKTTDGKVFKKNGSILLAPAESGGGDTINIKNGRLYGNVSYNNTTGDATNFSTTNYIDDYFNGLNLSNFEAVFKFTTGSDITSYQTIASFGTLYKSKNPFNEVEFKIQNGYFYGPYCISGTWANYDIFSLEANTTYYVKIIFGESNSTDFKYYMKHTAQEEYVFQKALGYYGFSKEYAKIHHLRIGNNIISMKNVPFSGIVHLNECYIKSRNTTIWDGKNISIKTNSPVKYAKKCDFTVCQYYDELTIDKDYKGYNFSTSPAYLSCFPFPSSGSNFTFYGRFTYDGNTNTQCIYDWEGNGSSWVNIALRNGYLSTSAFGSPTFSLDAGKTYDFKCEWDGDTNWNQYIKEATSDTWILDTTIDNFDRSYWVYGWELHLGVRDYNQTEAFTGELHLNHFKVTHGDTILWKAFEDEYSIVSEAYPYGQYYSGIATGNVDAEGNYEIQTVLGE